MRVEQALALVVFMKERYGGCQRCATTVPHHYNTLLVDAERGVVRLHPVHYLKTATTIKTTTTITTKTTTIKDKLKTGLHLEKIRFETKIQKFYISNSLISHVIILQFVDCTLTW